MNIDQSTLQFLLRAPSAPVGAKMIEAHLASGRTLDIRMDDGRRYHLETPMQAAIVMQEYFGWSTPSCPPRPPLC